MTTRTRIAITVASALALAVTDYGSTWTSGNPGLVPHLWDWSFLAAYGLAIVGVFFVDRWWALLPALAPLAAGLYMEYLTDYVSPWVSEEIRPSATGGYVVLVTLGIALQAAVLSVGFLPRRVWGIGRRLHLSRTTPRGTER
jgi:hypothetical protein